MSILPKSVGRLIAQLRKLPGLGPKTAVRLAFYLVKDPQADPAALGKSLVGLRAGLKTCSLCLNAADNDPCDICASASRRKDLLCVVEGPLDLLVIEKSGSFKGLYYLLGGRISPSEGIKPEDLFFDKLLDRLKKDKSIKEVILATNPTIEGDATAIYLLRLLKPLSVKVTRLARGLPSGGDLEYTDEITLSQAFERRNELK